MSASTDVYIQTLLQRPAYCSDSSTIEPEPVFDKDPIRSILVFSIRSDSVFPSPATGQETSRCLERQSARCAEEIPNAVSAGV